VGKRLYQLKNFGFKSELEVDGIGANAKMNEFQAAMGICNLRHIDTEIEKRKKVAIRYRENLKDVTGIFLLQEQKDVDSNYAYFPILVNEHKFGKTRDDLNVELRNHNIFSRKYFYPLTSEFECYKNLYNSNQTPIALEISKRVLTLPMYSSLSLIDVDRICEIIISLK